MNWRRGLILAEIHLAICIPLIVWAEARYWSQLDASATQGGAGIRRVAIQEEPPVITGEPVVVRFDCRAMWFHLPLQVRIVNAFELPAALLSGWPNPCPMPWAASSVLHLADGRHTRPKELAGACMLFVLIAAQWLLLGSVPLGQPRTWYMEPGTCLTACLAFDAAICVLASALDRFGTSPWVQGMMLAPGMLGLLAIAVGYLAWLLWLGLLIWRGVGGAWRITTRRAPASNS